MEAELLVLTCKDFDCSIWSPSVLKSYKECYLCFNGNWPNCFGSHISITLLWLSWLSNTSQFGPNLSHMSHMQPCGTGLCMLCPLVQLSEPVLTTQVEGVSKAGVRTAQMQWNNLFFHFLYLHFLNICPFFQSPSLSSSYFFSCSLLARILRLDIYSALLQNFLDHIHTTRRV